MTEHVDVANPAGVFELAETPKAISPDLTVKIQAAFLALEDALKEAFPKSRKLSLVLTYLEIAAMFAFQLLGTK